MVLLFHLDLRRFRQQCMCVCAAHSAVCDAAAYKIAAVLNEHYAH